ncbi:hypothetical protein HY389_00270 [Candidatus Daviesbacteria bacterium]|nr:hypothetical protein [Candidatus Daviesbacteria bacterium]
MQLILLHGPGEVGKRNQLIKIKQAFDPNLVTVVDLKQAETSDLNNALVAGSLFGSQRLIVVENLPDDLDLAKLHQADDNTTLLLVATASAGKTLLKSAQQLKAKIYDFEGEKETLVFPYLDNLIEGKRGAYVQLEKLLSEFGAMYVLSMIYYLLRRNLLPPPATTFMVNKIKNQKLKVKDQNWGRLYRLALEAEFKIKNGDLDEHQSLVGLTQKFLALT